MKRRITTLLAGGLLALAMFGVAAAGQLEDGDVAFSRGDYAEAMRLLRPLAELGDAEAQFEVSLMYFGGHGTRRNVAEAVLWSRKAAAQGYAPAQFDLSMAYFNGEGLPQDHILAHMWANLAAAQGNSNAAGFRDFVADHMTPTQIAEAQKMAREWAPK